MAATFRVSPSAPRLASLDLGASAIAGYWAGFWSRSGALEGTFSLTQSWARDGVYVFADSEPAALPALAELIASVVARSDPLGDLRMLWLRNSSGSAAVVSSGLRAAGHGDAATLTAACQLGYRGYAILLAEGSRLALAGNNNGFVITPTRADGLALTTRSGLGRLLADPGATGTIPLLGAGAGTIGFPLTLSDPALLDVGLRYFISAAEDPAVELPLAHTLATIDYPVLDPAGGPIRVQLQFDPVRPLDRDRSHLAFATANEPLLLSHFVDRLGRQLRLRPLLADGFPPARLVFTDSPMIASGEPGGEVSAYLCPEGAFELRAAAGPNGPRRVLAGLSGSEYVGFEAESGNRMIFVPDRPAYADGSEQLSSHAATSYVYFASPAQKRTVYYAQPDESLLWKTGRPDAFLEFMEVDAGRLPAPIDGSGQLRAVPWVPYRGVAADRAELARQFELRVLSPLRRAMLLEHTREQYDSPAQVGAPLATPDPTAVTSLGLLATFEPNNVWSRLYLAMPEDRNNPLMLAGATDDPQSGIKGPLRAALQSNQLCLVVTSKQAFERYGSLLNSMIAIEGWSFNLDPQVWNQHGTVLIFKFKLDPLAELLVDPSTWAFAETFNDDVVLTRERLRMLVAEARAAREQGDEDSSRAFAEFNRLLDTPQWQGVLALQVDLPLSGLPDAIAALAVGIDESEFKAHHVGVTLSPTQYDGSETLRMDPTAYFGLINYKNQADPSEQPGQPPIYQFRVESLVVRFFNSKVVDFDSSVKLRVGALFEEATVAEPATADFDPTLTLSGVLERHDGVPTYTFASAKPTRLAIDSDVLHDVELRQTQMKTASAPGIGGGLLAAYFQFGGAMRFRVQQGLDAFAFGTEPESDAKGGLEYSRMLLHMSATIPPPEQSNGPLLPSWRFDVTELIPDVPASTLRRRSLFARLPLLLAAVVQGEPGSTPIDKGFLPVNSPMDQAKIAAPWFALQFALNLGNLGNLVGGRGFIADLLVAWSPTQRGTSTFMGLRLPAPFGGVKAFRIQGLFKVGVSDIDLFVSDPDDPSYTMVLRDIGFELLSLKFPPVGGVNFVLFGDPQSHAKPGSLGWYLAYAKSGEAR